MCFVDVICFCYVQNEVDMAYIPFFVPRSSMDPRVGNTRNSRLTSNICTSNKSQNLIMNTDQTFIETPTETKNLEAYNRYSKYERNCNLMIFSHVLRDAF